MQTATKNKKEVKNLCFYTLEPEFTNLLRMFIEEGNFKKVYEILKDGGMPHEGIRSFFLYKIRFHGDSRTEKGLLTIAEPKKFDLKEIYTTAIATCLHTKKEYIENWEWKSALNTSNKGDGYSEDFACLNTILTADEIRDFAAVKLLARYGYKAKTTKGGEWEGNGVILRDGTYITCGYQDHINLYPILFQLGLASSSDWLDDDAVIHISSGQISGIAAYDIKRTKEQYRGDGVTEAQINSLFFFKNHINGEYGGIHTKSTCELIREYINIQEDHGGKYNNLAFLKRFYPQINLPKFSKEKMEGKVCIRTSPKYSMPGLLNSKFDINEDSIAEIEKEFKAAIKLTGKEFEHNELHYFYQEYLDGGNGVCHYWSKDKFTYAYSEKQGDVVKGVKTNNVLDIETQNKLRKIASMLYEDLKNPIQLEFVIKDGEVYIVQLRLLENNPKNTGAIYEPQGKVLVSGKTFSTGSEYGERTDAISLEDILIVESDADSKELIGKKALIVKSDVEFSHILALSKTLGIPSMFNTGEIDVKQLQGKKLNFVAKNEDAWITKSLTK